MELSSNPPENSGSLALMLDALRLCFYISSFVVLLGAEMNAEPERQIKRDKIKEPEKPIGFRDAKMADTVSLSTKKA